MSTELKGKIAFALLMGAATSGIISFTLVALNLGFPTDFATKWLRSWSVSSAIAIPTILLVGPRVQAQIDRLLG